MKAKRITNDLRMTSNFSEELRGALEEARAIVRAPFPWWLRPFVMRDVVAITLGRRIYLSECPVPSAQRPGEPAGHRALGTGHRQPGTGHSEPLLWHELTHVRQMREAGLLRFGWRYLCEYLRNRRSGMSSAEAYRNISYEREAFEAGKVHKNVDV
jgi:hypothetical protein